jgi:hypothetical protein
MVSALNFWAKIFRGFPPLSMQFRAEPFIPRQEFAGNLFNDKRSMENETRVVVVVGGERQVTL